MEIVKHEQQYEGVNLESELIALCKYGKPTICVLTKGWHCKIDMNTNAKGASFSVSSDYNLAGPVSALMQCKERAKAAVKKIAETV